MSDPEKIGKYRILGRIGRGGMGTIFKAHDPVLNRPVALKVISTEIEITEELRDRFFREAQACARLSHPNIVTVYDLGEDDGRIFIVMELLEGEELRRLIAERATVALEDKLSIMKQVCEGLHYAHRRGIVHRDIKPGNIMRLRNGQVKIFDFGIAQIENSGRSLTRTGLIMGTLRYIAPEQVRGHADHRSDIFSVGAVFYEFLSLQPPFSGENALHLLEEITTMDPVPLHHVDPTIPPELTAIVARAIRRDPAERFADLEQMRIDLERVQQSLAEEARRTRDRVKAHRDQLRRLHAALAENVGLPATETTEDIEETGHLAALQALEVDFAARVEAAHGMLTRAAALAPAFERGSELLQAGQFGDAVAEFEAVVADMPEHAPALDCLAQARAQADAQRRRQLAAKLAQDARAALEEREYTLCLEILKQAADIPTAAEAVPEIVLLRERAETALAAHEATRRARRHAEDARAQMARARLAAQTQAEVRHAPALWHEAEGKSTEAEAAFARTAHGDARQAFDAAAAAYRRFEERAREAQRQEYDAAQLAREQVAQGRQRAQAEEAPQHARELWDAAEVTFAEAQAALADNAVGHALAIFNKALAVYGQAEEAARETRQRERWRARMAPGEVAERAQATRAPHHGQEPLDSSDAAGAMADIPGATAEGTSARALTAGPEVAKTWSRRFREVTDDARRRETGWRWTWARGTVIVLGGLTMIVMGLTYWRSTHVPTPSAEKPAVTTSVPHPPTPVPSAGAGVTAELQDRPQPVLDEAARVGATRPPERQTVGVRERQTAQTEPDRRVLPPQRRSEQRGVESRVVEGRRDAEQTGAKMASARRAAEQAAAAYYAPKLLASAQAKEKAGVEALRQSHFGSAIRLLAEAGSDYQAAAQEARREADAERQVAALKANVEQARAATLARRGQALTVEAGRFARALLDAAEAKHAEADRLAMRQSFAAAARAYDEAAERYAEATRQAQATSGAK